MNLRSDLIKNTPILRAFALVSKDGEISLFTNDFSSLEKELSLYQNKTVGIAYNRTPKKIQTIMKDQHVWVHNTNNPIIDWKAIKNPISPPVLPSIIKLAKILEKNTPTINVINVPKNINKYDLAKAILVSVTLDTSAELSLYSE